MVLLAALLAVSSALFGAEDPLAKILERVSEQAESFRSIAPKVIARETLVQRAIKPQRHRLPVHIGSTPPKQNTAPVYQTREIVSEYGFAALKSAPGALHEFREVITVDGRPVATEAKARESLAAGLTSDDDRRRKRMLERFERHGLVGAAADFGQIILLFSRRRLDRYDFRLGGEARIGADRVRVVVFKEKGGQGSLLILERRQAIYRPMEGQIWIRERDGLPVRVWMRVQRDDHGTVMRDEATVDYVESRHGLIVPASVVHRQFAGSELRVENVFRYSPFRMFSAEADIKFQ